MSEVLWTLSYQLIKVLRGAWKSFIYRSIMSYYNGWVNFLIFFSICLHISDRESFFFEMSKGNVARRINPKHKEHNGIVVFSLQRSNAIWFGYQIFEITTTFVEYSLIIPIEGQKKHLWGLKTVPYPLFKSSFLCFLS